MAEQEKQEALKRKAEVIIQQTQCNDCGKVINAGTYGIIFEDKTDSEKIIKGSIKGHGKKEECKSTATDFGKEFYMLTKILEVFPSTTIRMVQPYDNIWFEKRHCYIRMDKLNPIILDKSQKEQAIHLLSGRNDIHKSQEFLTMLTTMSPLPLFKLTPRYKNKFHHIKNVITSHGMGAFANWVEIGEIQIRILFEIIGLDYDKYIDDLATIIITMSNNNIILNDIEFLLANAKGQSGVFMIDFDKTFEVESSDPEELLVLLQRNLSNEECFPNTKEFTEKILSSVKQPAMASSTKHGGRRRRNRKTKRKQHKKRKKKNKRLKRKKVTRKKRKYFHRRTKHK